MIKRNAAKPVRVAPPMMEEQEVSTSTLQELLEKEETVSNLRHSANVNSVLLSWQIYGLRTATCPIYLLQKAPFTG